MSDKNDKFDAILEAAHEERRDDFVKQVTDAVEPFAQKNGRTDLNGPESIAEIEPHWANGAVSAKEINQVDNSALEGLFDDNTPSFPVDNVSEGCDVNAQDISNPDKAAPCVHER